MRACWAAAAAILLAACSHPDQGLTVSAAASLQVALTEIGRMYPTPLSMNYGSSGTLAQQIEQGAPADVFFSAAREPMDRLASKGLIAAGTRSDVLRNQVVLVAPRGSNLKSFEDLAQPAVKLVALGDPGSVPAGQYGKQTLTSLHLWDAVEPKLLLAKDVRQVLTYVETGNADAGIVYATDARTGNVQVAARAPESTHEPVVYPIGVVAASRNRRAARLFVEWIGGPAASPVFQRFGFEVIRK